VHRPRRRRSDGADPCRAWRRRSRSGLITGQKLVPPSGRQSQLSNLLPMHTHDVREPQGHVWHVFCCDLLESPSSSPGSSPCESLQSTHRLSRSGNARGSPRSAEFSSTKTPGRTHPDHCSPRSTANSRSCDCASCPYRASRFAGLDSITNTTPSRPRPSSVRSRTTPQ